MVRWLSWAMILTSANHRPKACAAILTGANDRGTSRARILAFQNGVGASLATTCANQNALARRLADVLDGQDAKSKLSAFRFIVRFGLIFLPAPFGSIKKRFHQFALSWKRRAQHAVNFFQYRPDAQPGLQFRISR
jgi:hypothetical protein